MMPRQFQDRESFFNALDLMLAEHRGGEKSFALMLISLDHLRQLNISYGYSNGDLLLAEFAERIKGRLRDCDDFFRIGSSDFAVLAPRIFNSGHALLAATKILACLEESLMVDKFSVELSARMGIAIYPEHGGNSQELCSKAEIALIESARLANRYSIFSPDISRVDSSSRDIAIDLRNAIEQDQFEMYYQPQICLSTGRLYGVEALIRWKNGSKGFISPDIFIPIAEKHGLIFDITKWTLNAVLWASHNWPESKEPLKISINLSAKMLGRPGLIEAVKAAVKLHSVDYNRITLEITESALVEDVASSFKSLEELKKLGLNISIDDFGTGYSSMAYFKNIPAVELKIDRTFVRNILSDQMDEHVVKTIIQMAGGFGLEVVAEGIEDRETFDKLKALGCDVVQGYYFSKPLAQNELIEWMNEYRSQY